jgi:predicted short-subunit dehydrogenase-like oxidoreductase (DUF2520 family)
MRAKLTIAVVGAGSLGSVLAVLLHEAGFSIREVVSRAGPASRRRARALARRVGARALVIGDPGLTANVVWLCVPDREISECARSLAASIPDWEGRIVLHSSGALTSDELGVLRGRGARVASAHPLMTFVHGSRPSLAGVGFAVEGDRAAGQIAREMISRLGGEFYPISKKHKALYHAWATFASPLLTVLLAVSEEIALAAGVCRPEARRRLAPILRETVNNYARVGAGPSFSGPIVRGDAATVEKHLEELMEIPEAADVYRALALAALKTLPAKNQKALERVLKTRLRGASLERQS